jgi:pimeloyl-ACP methyl ester carboxylesterase
VGQDNQALALSEPPAATHDASETTSAVARTAVSFENKQGLHLFGILERATGRPTSDTGILMLSPGIKMRVGPERLYRRMSEAFVAMGHPVLRFDYYGLGDSEGTLSERTLKDVYMHIETGRYIDDVRDAMDWMERHHGVKRFIASGLCGGAVTGLLAARQDSRIAGLLALSITPVLSTTTDDVSRYMTAGQLTSIRRRYILKLLNPTAWLRLLTMKSDYRTIWRSALQPLQPLRVRTRRTQPTATLTVPANDNASPLFPPAFFHMLETDRPMLLIFGGSDRLHFEFEEKFVARHRARFESYSSGYDMHVIEQANHVFTFDAWQRELLQTACAWLGRHFAASNGVVV